MDRVLVFDPGESTGWILWIDGEITDGGTAKQSHSEIVTLIQKHEPTIIVLERFHLFPGAAKSFAWNTFYPCEVIGVIRYFAECGCIELVEQNPSVKKFAGNFGMDWERFNSNHNTTEHTKDAYLHLKYFLKNKLHKLKEVK